MKISISYFVLLSEQCVILVHVCISLSDNFLCADKILSRITDFKKCFLS